jgi:hypothetical protein
VQVDPIKPVLKAHGTNLLTPEYNKALSNLAFKFYLRRCIVAGMAAALKNNYAPAPQLGGGRAFTRPLFSST